MYTHQKTETDKKMNIPVRDSSFCFAVPSSNLSPQVLLLVLVSSTKNSEYVDCFSVSKVSSLICSLLEFTIGVELRPLDSLPELVGEEMTVSVKV